MNSHEANTHGQHTRAASKRTGGLALSRGPGRAAIAALLTLGALALPATALAATRPTATTDNARSVSYASATLTGSVNPNGSDTSYYFQYGLTKAYGAQTAIADAGAGTRKLSVSLGVTGLEPLTEYHYRLVAVNGAGATIGDDRTLLTTKVPLSLAILASPNPTVFGGTATIQGTLSGTNNAAREVVLQGNAFPYTAGFTNVGNPEITLASGGFSFLVPGLSQVTQFRVVTTTNPPVVSPVTVENVAVKVVSHVKGTKRLHHARVYGTVTPAESGMQVGILRITHGHGVLVGGTILRPLNATSSQFSRVVPVKAGVYRVLVRVTSGAQVSSYGSPLLIR